jgi:hypothetical protein
MRKRYRVLILAALVAALIVPVGFALSLESSLPTRSSDTVVRSTVPLPDVPDAAKLFAVGTLLIGLAAFVRKAA